MLDSLQKKMLKISSETIRSKMDMWETSVTDPDPFHLGLPGPDLFHETDPGSKNCAKIMERNHSLNQPKSQKNIIL